jgi:transcriptional regulator with XRE-family HTH domain
MTAGKTLGYRLARHRADRGWSLRQAAAASGVPHMTIQRAENGADLRISLIAKLAKTYGTTLDALTAEEPTP